MGVDLCLAVILFLLRSKLDNKVLVFHPVVYKEYSYHETYSETLTTSTGSKKNDTTRQILTSYSEVAGVQVVRSTAD